MLMRFRERILGWFGMVILALIIATFSLFGISGYFTNTDVNVVATVGEQEITVTQFRDLYLRMYQQRRDFYGERFRPELIDEPRLAEEALESLVAGRLLEIHAEDAGYRVTDRAVRDEIMNEPSFQSNGEFSRELYQVRLATAGMSTKGFEFDVRQDLQTRQVEQAIRSSEFILPYELNRTIALRDEKRQYASISVPAGKFYSDTGASEEEIAAYYEENAAAFMTPETVDIQFIELTVDQVAGDIEITEEMLRARYDREADLFLDQEQRRASHILIDASAGEQAATDKAIAIRERLNAGEDFAALAAEFSDDPGSAGEGGSLGLLQRGILVGPFEDALFAMQQGAISEPVKTDFGFHIIRLDEIVAPQARPFEEVREEIATQLRADLIEQRFYNEAQRLNQYAFENPETLDVAAEALGVEVEVQTGVTRNSQVGIAADEIVRSAAFSDKVLGDRYNSDLLEVGSNHVLIIRVSEHHLPETRSLDVVKEEIVDRIRQRQANDMARALAEQLLARIEAGEDMSLMADEHLLPYTPPRTVNRARPGIPFDLADALFDAPTPGEDAPVSGITAVGANEYAIYKILSSVPGDPGDLTSEERESRKRRLAGQQSFYAMNAYVEDQKKRVGVVRREGNLLDQ